MCNLQPSIKTKFDSNREVLGKGSFGEVKEIDGMAVKKVSLSGNTGSIDELKQEIYFMKLFGTTQSKSLPQYEGCYYVSS